MNNLSRWRANVFFLFSLVTVAAVSLRAQSNASNQIAAVAATPSGSGIVVGVNNDRSSSVSQLLMASPTTGAVVWKLENLPTIGSVTVSPDGGTVAAGLVGVPDSAAGVLLLDAKTGKQTGALGVDLALNFMPGTVYSRYGSGVSQLQYSPDGALLYGLSNDTLFAWDVAAKKYLWTRDVPAVIEAPQQLPDPLPYGHATGFALSPDGRQIAAIRDALRVATAGRMRPGHFIERKENWEIASAAFSPDGRILAAGEFGFVGKTTTYVTELWINGALRSVGIEGCGDEIAWTADPAVFGCQNDSGTHLRNIHDPQKNIGVAGPVSDLPILKAGGSLWAVGYRNGDWKDPAKGLPLTLVELGTGRRVTVTLPGRTQARASVR
jgi:WD40 repeat protein